MANFNLVVIAGNLTRDPELSYLPSGTPMTKASVAVKNWRAKEEDAVDFFDVVFFGKLAEVVSTHRRKGDAMLVQGRLHQSRWQSPTDGANRSRIEIVGDGIEFM